MKTNAGKVSRSQHPRILGIIIELSAKVRTAIHLSQADGGFSFVSKSFGSPQLYTPQGLPSSWIPWALGCPPDLETNKNLPAGRSPRFAIDRRNLGFTADLGMKRAIILAFPIKQTLSLGMKLDTVGQVYDRYTTASLLTDQD